MPAAVGLRRCRGGGVVELRCRGGAGVELWSRGGAGVELRTGNPVDHGVAQVLERLIDQVFVIVSGIRPGTAVIPSRSPSGSAWRS
jgi:hypothetical protein